MILDKAKMAHDYAIEMLKRGDPERSIAFDAWMLVDTMQAEADKRVVKLPDVFFDTKSNEEWQPDWSQAPDWANWWVMTKGGFFAWVDSEPRLSNPHGGWLMSRGKTVAPSFNYAGNWQDSLRKRPQ